MHGFGIIKARKHFQLHSFCFHKATKPCKYMVLALSKPKNIGKYTVWAFKRSQSHVKCMVLALANVGNLVNYMVFGFTRPQKVVNYMVLSQRENYIKKKETL